MYRHVTWKMENDCKKYTYISYLVFVPRTRKFCILCIASKVNVKVKVKFIVEQSTEAQRGSIVITLLFL
jgi:hypothetical protein